MSVKAPLHPFIPFHSIPREFPRSLSVKRDATLPLPFSLFRHHFPALPLPLPGYRIGYSASPLSVAKAVGKLQSQMTSCASSIGQQVQTLGCKTYLSIAKRVKHYLHSSHTSYRFHQLFSAHATNISRHLWSQAALVALNSVSESWMEDRIEELRAKRNLALELVRSIQDVHCPTPMGAFYIMPDVSELVGLDAIHCLH